MVPLQLCSTQSEISLGLLASVASRYVVGLALVLGAPACCAAQVWGGKRRAQRLPYELALSADFSRVFRHHEGHRPTREGGREDAAAMVAYVLYGGGGYSTVVGVMCLFFS